MSNQDPAFSEATKNSKLKRYSQDERNHHLEEWKKSNLSMSQYCRDKVITVSTLSKWVRSPHKAKTKFKPVTLSSASFYNRDSMIEIIIDNRIKLRLPAATNPSVAINIVKGLMQCN